MKICALLFSSLLATTGICRAEIVDSHHLTQEIANQLNIGETFQIRFTIAKGDFGSSSKDRSEISTYTAPTGIVILGHSIEKTGHHSSASYIKTDQAGAIKYENSAMSKLQEKIKEGFLKGALTWKGKKIFEGDASANYASFLREFEAKYHFQADTHSSISFKWTTDTKNGRHGAKIDASAIVTLAKAGTTNDINRALQIIEFQMQTDAPKEIFEVIDAGTKTGKTASELGLKNN